MDYLIKASAVIALFYLCFYLFLKKETFFNHNRWFLLIGIVIALIFPFVVIPIEIVVEPMLVPETAFTISENIPVTIQKPIPESKFEWQSLLPIIYSIGLAVFLIQFLFQFGSLILLLLKNPKNKDGIYTYVIVNNKISPFSFFKWIVYNPESFNDEELKLMLTHEKVHANQLHSIDILLIQLACSIFWFNPLMWLYRKEVRQNLEYIADYKTQEKSNSEIEYQRLLLKTSVANHNISLPNNFYNSLIKERIVMLKKSRSNRKKQWKYLLMLPLLAGLLMSMNTEKTYVETESTIKTNESTIEFVVTKNTSDVELKAMTYSVEKKGGTLVFKEIERNNKNELTGVFLTLNNHSYGNGYSNQPIEDFLIYKEFFEFGGGYVGSNGMGTMHFNDAKNIDNPEVIKSFKTRANQVLLKNQLTTLNLNNKIVKIPENIEIIFTKEMTKKQLDEIKKELKSNGIEMNIKRLNRNDKGDISDIDIDFKTENGSANYNVKNKNGIASFYFKIQEDGSFGVGAINNNKDIIVVEGFSKAHKDSNNNIFIHKTEGEVIEIIEDSTHNHNIKIIKGHSGSHKIHSSDSIIIKNSFSSENPFFTRNGDTIHIIKDSLKLKTNYFYQSSDTPVKVHSTSEHITIHNPKQLNQNSFIYRNDNSTKPLYVVNGKVIKDYSLNTVNPNNIEKIHVLKGDSATELYGEKGENGVLVITTKDINAATVNKEIKSKSPWRVEVGGMNYVDEDDPRKNSTLAYLTKYTSDKVLENHKKNLKKAGITVKFSKLKRNKAREITSIKISISNDKGAKSSATWKSNDGIPGIEFGETEGSLIARTSDMN